LSEPLHPSTDNGVLKHWQNFIDVIHSRKFTDLRCPIQVGSDVATVAQMGNIAYRSGQKLFWDNTKEAFTDASINKDFLMKTYHNGYQLPKP
jgi:hypothetical protein